MKKLMIAAAAFAMAFATVAADCGCNTCNTCSTDCVYAYEFILLAKSTEGKPVTKVVKSTCACECDTVCGSKCYRKPRMRKYAGFVVGITNGNADEEDVKAGCASACTCLDFVKEGAACACGQLESLDDYIGDNAVWGGQYFWDVRTKKAVDAALWFTQLDAIGYQSRETIEAVGYFAVKHALPVPANEEEATGADEEGESKIGVLTLAGFGKRGKKGNGVIMVKNISGFFAGQLPVYCENCEFNNTTCSDNCSGEWAVAWTICSDVEYAAAEDDTGDGLADPNEGLTAAYGKWTLKWNATAAAKLTKSYNAGVLVKPGYDASLTAKYPLQAAAEDGE